MFGRASGTRGGRGCLIKQGLNYVKSHIREASAQAHPECPRRPKTYS